MSLTAERLDRISPSQTIAISSKARALKAAGFTVYDVSDAVRSRGWLVPAYKMPPAIDDVSVLRIVVRNGFTRDLVQRAAVGDTEPLSGGR